VTSVVVFILVCYSIAFLVADASIFGCGTVAYNEDPTDEAYIRAQGILKIRPYFLRVSFFQKLFTCYFCLGVWVGPVAHVLLYFALQERYFFHHESTIFLWVLHSVMASLLSATGCLLVNVIIDRLDPHEDEDEDDEELERGDHPDHH
jgi:hypothetical protein